jgi:2-keto-4-pentenoate hydratase/2-oxohepta-3-ene-1,7-dioic acid hydratase in catechol pathway
MKICRFNGDRLGLVEGDEIVDVTAALADMPAPSWPAPMGDLLIAQWGKIAPGIVRAMRSGARIKASEAQLLCPLTSPSKVIGIARNRKNLSAETLNFELSKANREDGDPIDMFIKAPSALSGPADGVTLRFPDGRNDPEVELTVIIGKRCADVAYDDALDAVFGYTIGLDMTLRDKGSASSRKSLDSFAPLGPWIVTADEIADPDNLSSSLTINGEMVQQANTRDLAFDVRSLIANASRWYTLHPGDAIMVGTPVGFKPVKDGDVMVAEFESIGAMTVAVKAYKTA